MDIAIILQKQQANCYITSASTSFYYKRCPIPYPACNTPEVALVALKQWFHAVCLHVHAVGRSPHQLPSTELTSELEVFLWQFLWLLHRLSAPPRLLSTRPQGQCPRGEMLVSMATQVVLGNQRLITEMTVESGCM